MAPRGRSVKKRKYEQEHVKKALIRMLIFYQLPFSAVEEEGFKELMETTFPGFQIPSSETIFRYCAQLFMNEKLKLKSFIKGTKQRVCLTLNTWMSKQLVNYLIIIAHFIDDDWNLHKYIINFTPVSSDEGEEIGSVVEKCLRYWEIDNVMTISTGNRSSYDVAVSYLRGRLANSVADGKFLHLKCFADFTNSLVKQVLNENDKSIARVRAAVKYVLQSPARIEKFKKRARECRIISKSFLSLDCPTKWNSTFTMLETAKEFEVIVDLFEDNDPTYTDDLENACGVVTFLKGFYQSTVNILGSYVTSNMFLEEVADIDFHLSNCGTSCGGNDEQRFFKALDMKCKFYEYWGDVEKSNLLIYVANILDPRRKMDFIEFYFMNNDTYKHEYTDEEVPLWKKKVEFVISAIYDLFNEYTCRNGGPQQNANFQTSGYMHYLYEDTSHRGLGQRRTVGFGGNVKFKTEIDIYLSDDSCQDFNGFDILLWWKQNSARFPVLSKMAKDVLAIPILAMSSGSAFSTTDNVLDDFRSSLSPEVVEGLVCTKDWISEHIKVEEVPTYGNFVKGMLEQLELGDATRKVGFI